MAVTIYHNPKCTKSRATLALLGGARAFARPHEDAWSAAGLDDDSSDEAILQAMTEHPILIERPIVVVDGVRATIGRPPERVLEIL